MTLSEFDIHLDSYLKVTGKKLTPKIFYTQYWLTHMMSDKKYWERYREFKKNSRHMKQLGLVGV